MVLGADEMITLFVGRPDAGNARFLKRVQVYFDRKKRRIHCRDLVTERVRFVDFVKQKKHALEIKQATFVLCGPDFNPALVPSDWRVIWLKQDGDLQEETPLGSARLAGDLLPFAERADEILWLSQISGSSSDDVCERDLITGNLRDLRAATVVGPALFRDLQLLEEWIHLRLKWGVRWFELRDDWLTPNQMRLAITLIPMECVLVSFRAPERVSDTCQLVHGESLAYDWPVDWDASHSFGLKTAPRLLSLRSRLATESMSATLRRFPTQISHGTQLRASFAVHDLHELALGHEWMSAFGEARIFLPQSADGRWCWYHQWKGSRTEFNFLRETQTCSLDQPTLLQWIRRRRVERSARLDASRRTTERPEFLFAGVLVETQSRVSSMSTDLNGYFAQYGASVFTIPLTEAELGAGALTTLGRLGLRWATIDGSLQSSVTALAKKERTDFSRPVITVQCSGENDSGKINTLSWNPESQSWHGTNSDASLRQEFFWEQNWLIGLHEDSHEGLSEVS
jgi:hypothetical protein